MAVPGVGALRSFLQARSAARAAARDYTGLGDSLKSLAQSALSPMNASIGLIVVTNRLAAAGRAAHKEQVELARQLGVTSQAVAGLTTQFRQANMTVQQAAAPLRTFNQLLGRAAGGSREANEALQRAGVTLERFRSMSAAEQMRQLGRHLREIRDPADRARVAVELFGDGAEEAMRVLERVPDVNADAIASFRRVSVTARDAAALRRQEMAGAELGTATSQAGQGFAQEMAATWAPILTFLTDLGTRAMEVIQPVLNGVALMVRVSFLPLNLVVGVIQGIGEMIAPIWEGVLEVCREIDAVVREMFGAGEGGLMEFAKALGRGFGMLKPMIDNIVAALKVAAAAARAAGNLLAGGQNLLSSATFGLVPRAGGGAQAENAAQTTALVQQQQEMERTVRDQIRSLELQTRAVGQASFAMEYFRLELEGATQEQLRRFTEAQARLAGEQAVQGQVDAWRRLTLTARQALEFQLRQQGVAQPQVVQAERLRFGNAVVQRALNPQEFRSVSTMGFGSSAAMETINRNQFMQSRDPMERLIAAQAEQRDIEAQQRDYLRQLVEAAERLGVGDVGPV